MDHANDVEHLFSWLKTPEVRYREFAMEREVPELLLTRPVPPPIVEPTREASAVSAAASSAAARDQGPRESRERVQANERRVVREAVAPRPVIDRRESPPSRRSQPSRAYDEPVARREPERYGSRAVPAAQSYPAERGAQLFRSAQAPERRGAATYEDPAPARSERSLDEVFSRLSGSRNRLPDPRDRRRTSPGLGAVFSRLR